MEDKKLKQLERLSQLEKEPNLSLYEELSDLNEKLEAIQGVLSNINVKEIKTYESEIEALQSAILSLTESVNSKDTVVNIPLDQLSDKIGAVELAIKGIKEVKIPEFPSELSLNETQINELLLAIQSIPEFPKDNVEKLFKNLEKKIGEINLEIPGNDFDYDFLRTKFDSLIKSVKGISISVGSGGFPERSQNNLINIEANQTNLTQKTKIFDSWGDEIGSTMIDELMVSQKNRISGGVFNGTTPDTNFYTTVANANGTATIANSILDTKVTTDSGSSILVYTNTVGRYVGGNMNHLRGIFRVGDTGKTNNTRQIGVTALADLADSFYFQLSGTTFSIVANTTGLAQIKIDNGSFNGDITTYPMTTNFHTWEILFTNKRIQFYIDKVLIHTLTETTSPICGTRHLRPFIRNTNAGVGSETHLYCQALTMLCWGSIKTQPKYYYQAGTTAGVLLKTGIGSLHMLNISGVVNNATVTLYDGTSTAGTVVYSSGAMTNQTVPLTVPFNDGIQFSNGLFLTITSANCNAQVIYE